MADDVQGPRPTHTGTRGTHTGVNDVCEKKVPGGTIFCDNFISVLYPVENEGGCAGVLYRVLRLEQRG